MVDMPAGRNYGFIGGEYFSNLFAVYTYGERSAFFDMEAPSPGEGLLQSFSPMEGIH